MRSSKMKICKLPLLLVAIFILHVNAAEESQPFVKVTPTKLQNLPTFTSPGFKSLLLHDDKLYVGGLDHLYTQNPEKVDEKMAEAVTWKAQPSRCRSAVCSNYIRNIVPYNHTHLLLCGAMTQTARNAYYNIETGELREDKNRAEVICSATPTETIVSQIIVDDDNNAQVIATSRPDKNFKSKIRLIKTLKDEDKVIETPTRCFRDPRFAASFIANDRQNGVEVEKVYFIFHEKADQPGALNRAARITQVCSNDEGYLSYTSGTSGKVHWTSLLSLRLKCALKDDSEIFDNVTDMLFDGEFLYGTFTNGETSINRASAVCAFSLAQIQKMFREGDFWHFNTNLGSYEISLRQNTPAPAWTSPGRCLLPGMGVNSTRDYEQNYAEFLDLHALMHKPVISSDPRKSSAAPSPPLLFMNSQHFTTIASYEVTSLNGDKYKTFFVGTTSGVLIKLRQIDEKSSRMIQLVQYEISKDAIKTLQIAPQLDQLYVATESAIKQVPVSDCEIYGSFCQFCNPCQMCILSHDPSCAWSTSQQKCTSFVGMNTTNGDLIQHLHTNNVEVCGDAVNKTYYKSAPPSDATVVYGEKSETMNAKWRKKDASSGITTNIELSDEKLEVDQMKRLIINNFLIPNDYGTYICEYSIGDVIVGRVSYVVANQLTHVNNNNKGITKVPEVEEVEDVDKSHVVRTDDTPLYVGTTTSSINGTVVDEASFSKMPLQILLAVIAVVALGLIFILFYRIRRRGSNNLCCQQKMSDYEMNTNPNTNTQSSPQSMDTNKNMSNNGRMQQKADEFDYYHRDHSEASNFEQSPEKENLIGAHGRKVAAVKPNNCSMNFEDDSSIPYVDDGYDLGDGLINQPRTSPLSITSSPSPLQTSMTLGRHDTRKKKRNLVNRSTSIPAQKIFVTVNNQKHRCSKVIRTEHDTYIFEVSGLSDLQITNDTDHNITLQPTNQQQLTNSSSSASTIQPPPNHYDDDVTSSHTPSPIGSLNSLLTRLHDTHGDVDDVTPVSTSSSDQYTTAPPSPFKMMTSNRSSYA